MISRILNHPKFARWYFTIAGVVASFFIGLGIGRNNPRPTKPEPTVLVDGIHQKG